MKMKTLFNSQISFYIFEPHVNKSIKDNDWD